MKFSAKNLLAGLIIVVVLAVVIMRGDQLSQLWDTIKTGSLVPLVIAPIVQLGKYGLQSFAYSWCFKAVDVKDMHAPQMLPLVFGCFFVNTVAPSFNLAGTTLVVDDARRRGVKPGVATSAALLMQITIDTGFALIMILGFLLLEVTVGLSPMWFAAGLVVVVLVGGMVLLMIVGHLRPRLLARVLTPVQGLVNKVLVKLKRKPMKPWAESIATSFSEAGGLIRKNPLTTLAAFGFSVGASLCELACFVLVGVAFGVHAPEPLICGYVVATLFAMISITPQGVGVVEAAVVVAFTSFGSSAAAGLSIALVYRSIVFWMPFLVGAVLIQTTKAFKGSAKKAVRTAEHHAGAGPKGAATAVVRTAAQPGGQQRTAAVARAGQKAAEGTTFGLSTKNGSSNTPESPTPEAPETASQTSKAKPIHTNEPVKAAAPTPPAGAH
ncbi:lysylphosphatidylglycerol synthase transmembrane domain-containing protein [Xiamenia xianingshaonis]|uniref:lysylphosphatidylglycerol synthase transmembrane domain-containing protein n=1 Tax=Xiamenia xianingshaonis TaxID=2682776 RepID=UPI0021BD4A0A|nr:lysylphosphatidylglycerol synthase transmembrane domain-containing protein [Xiamenia xianingshaonis]